MRQLELVDDFLAAGRDQFTFAEAQAALGRSAPGTANALRQLSEKGLVDRLRRGHYAIRPLGSLGTSAVTDDLPLAVGAAFAGREHRIAYLSALGEHGLLSHPVRTVFVACTKQVRMRAIGRRPIRVVSERPETIYLESERLADSCRSTMERALFECALRIDLTGGPERLAEALSAGASEIEVARVHRLARAFGQRGFAAERRLASLAAVLAIPLGTAPRVEARQPVIRLDPREAHVEWIDKAFRVAWSTSADELRSVVNN